MSKWLTIRVDIPEDYEDVHPDLVLEDFLNNPKAFTSSIVLVGSDDKKNENL